MHRAFYEDCGVYVIPIEVFLKEVPENKENPTGQRYRFKEYNVKSVK